MWQKYKPKGEKWRVKSEKQRWTWGVTSRKLGVTSSEWDRTLLESFKQGSYFNFWHFNCNMSWWGSLCVQLIWYSVSFLNLIWISVSFSTLRKFIAIISSNRFSVAFLSLLFLRSCNANMIVLGVYTLRSLSYLHFNKSFFFLVLCLDEFHCPVFQISILSPISLRLLLSPLVYFSVQLLYSSTLWLLFGTFLYFLSFYWSSVITHSSSEIGKLS